MRVGVRRYEHIHTLSKVYRARDKLIQVDDVLDVSSANLLLTVSSSRMRRGEHTLVVSNGTLRTAITT